MTDPAERFQAELTVLRDRVVRALHEDNITDLKDGLDLYSGLITTVLEQFRKYESIVGPSGLGLRSFYGREMSWLEDDIRTFLRAASREPGSDATHHVLGFLLGLVIEAFNRKELPAFGSFLEKHRFAWYSGRHDGPPEGWPRIRSNILLTLENFGDHWVGRELGRREDAEAATPFARRLVAELVQLMKQAVDDGSSEDLQAAARALNETMRLTVERVEDRSESEGPSDWTSRLLSISRLKAAALLGIEAWIILRHDAGKTEASEAKDFHAVIRDLSTSSPWLAYLTARDRETSELLSWTWWETGLWEDRRAGVLAFDEFLDRAFAAQLIDGRAELPEGVDAPNAGIRYRLERLMALVEEFAAQERTRPPFLGRPGESRVGAVRQRLADLIAALQTAEDDALIALGLGSERVEQFRGAVVEAWKSPRHIRSLVPSLIWKPPLVEPEEAPAEQQPEGFGSNTLVPKEFFAEVENVHADPAHIGREFGDGLGRGEGALILSRLQATLAEVATSLESFAAKVDRSVDDLIRRGLRPSVVIINSWRLLRALRHRDLEPEGAWATAGLEQAPRLKRTNTPLLLRYEEGGELCIVADFRAVMAIRHRVAKPELPGDTIHEDGRLLIGVRQLDEAKAREMIAASPRFKSINGSELADDEAVRRIRKQVHVRVLEWIVVEVRDRTAGVIIRVEEARDHGEAR